MAVSAATTYIVIKGDLSSFSRDMKVAEQMAKRGGQTVSSSFTGQNLVNFGKQMTLGVTLPLGLAAKEAISLATDFEKTMNTMRAVAGVPGPELEKLRELAVQLGQDTVFSTNEAGQAMLELSKAGVSTSDIMGGALKNALDLATAGDLDLATAATTAANAMNVFGLTGKQSQQAADALAGAANASSANVADLTEALAQGGNAANSAGLSIQEATAALAAFADQGIRGSDAGTSLKTFMLNLVPTTERAKDKMRELDLSFVDANGSILGLTEIAAELQRELGDLSQAEQQTALKVIFGTDAFRAANVIMNQGADGMAKYIGETSKVGNAAEVAAGKMAGWPGILEQLKGSLETAGLVVGQVLIPALSVLSSILTDVLNAFTALPGPIKGVIVGIGAIAAAAGPAMIVVGKLSQAIKFFTVVQTGSVVAMTGFQVAMGTAVTSLSAFVGNLIKAAPWLAIVAAGVAVLNRLFAEHGLSLEDAREGLDGLVTELAQGALTVEEYARKLEDLAISAGESDQVMRIWAEGVRRFNAQDMKDGFEGAGDALEGLTKKAQRAGETFVDAKGKLLVFAGMTRKEFKTWERDTIGNFNLVSGRLDALADKHKVTADKIIASFRRALAQQIEFGENWKEIAERAGGDADGLLAHIQENFGAQAPALVAALADANRREFNEIVGLWNEAGSRANNMAGAVGNSFDNMAGKINHVTTLIQRQQAEWIALGNAASLDPIQFNSAPQPGGGGGNLGGGGPGSGSGTDNAPGGPRVGVQPRPVIFQINADSTTNGRKLARLIREELEADRHRDARIDRARLVSA